MDDGNASVAMEMPETKMKESRNSDMMPEGKRAEVGDTLGPPTNPMVSALLTDMYQITMAYAYWKSGKQNDQAV